MIKATKYIAAGLIAAAMAACQSTADEPSVQPSPDKYICFGVPAIKVDATVGNFADTPASRASSSLTNSIGKFMVWGYCVPNNISGGENQSAAVQEWNDKSTFFTGDPDVFKEIVVTNNGGFTSYDIDALAANNQFRQWNDKADARYAFIAGYAPSGTFSMERALQTTDVDDFGKNLSHGPKLTFTMPHSGNNINEVLSPASQPDAMLAARFDHKQTDGRVNLSFFHFMTGLRFKFHNHTENKELVIKKVTFQGVFHQKAVFDFTTDEPVMTVSDTYSGTFVLFEGSQTIGHGSADYMGVVGEGDNPVNFLILPNPAGTTNKDDQYTLGSNKEIRITYSIGGSEDKTFVYGNNFTLNYIPQPNTLHTAHFNFVGDEFVVFFQADDKKNWENGSDNPVIIQ